MAGDMEQFAPPMDLPITYFNGFQIGLTNSDVSLILLCNGQPRTIANVSFTTAKTLHLALGELITSLENTTKRDIMTMQEIGQGLEKLESLEPVVAEGHSDG